VPMRFSSIFLPADHSMYFQAMLSWIRTESASCLKELQHKPTDLHLRQHIANYVPIVVFSHVKKLWPRQDVVEVVLQSITIVNGSQVLHGRDIISDSKLSHLQLIVFGQTKQVAGLHCQQVIDCCRPNANHTKLVSRVSACLGAQSG